MPEARLRRWLVRASYLTFLAAADARADGLFVDPSVLVRETVTTNANYATPAIAERDDLTELGPALVLRAISSNLTVNANVRADMIDYREHTEPFRILPNGGVDAVAELEKSHFYVDAAVMAAQYQESIFGATVDLPTSFNVYTLLNWRLSPYYKGLLPGGVAYVVRVDESLIRGFGGNSPAAVNSNLGHQSVEFDSAPRPFGWSAQVESNATTYLNAGYAETRESLARVIGKAAYGDWVGGLRAGVEQENFLLDDHARAIGGVGLTWQPSNRTTAELIAEHRFYGTQWDYSFKHASPRLGLQLIGGRDVLTPAQTTFALPATGHDMAAMLDSMLQGTNPDPIDRARAVQSLISQQNLPDSNAAAFPAYYSTPLLVTSHRVVLTLLAKRDSIDLAAYVSRMALPGTLLSPVFIPAGFGGENFQRGVYTTLTHRLDPTTTVSATGRITVVDGLGVSSGEYTRQNAVSLQLSHFVSPRTELMTGVRLQAIESNQTTQAREKAIWVGALRHI